MDNKFVAGTFNALRFARVNARKTIVLKQYISKKYCLVKKKHSTYWFGCEKGHQHAWQLALTTNGIKSKGVSSLAYKGKWLRMHGIF